MINSRELINIVSAGQIPQRVPFVPTIYEHAALFAGTTPSKMAQNPDLIVEGQLKSYEAYKQDIVSVGVDIYNIEAEAIGCSVLFKENAELPSIKNTIIKNMSDLTYLKVPDTEKDGRMPVMLEACRRINEKIGNEVYVSGTVVGPFTLAAILRGFENFLMDIIFYKEFAIKQLEFSAKVAQEYARAFIRKGIGVVINESWISPPLLSPDIFKSIVFEFEVNLISKINASGLKNVALICGGNTFPIADALVETGTSLLIADYNTDQKEYKQLCQMRGINLRASIDPKVLEEGDVKKWNMM